MLLFDVMSKSTRHKQTYPRDWLYKPYARDRNVEVMEARLKVTEEMLHEVEDELQEERKDGVVVFNKWLTAKKDLKRVNGLLEEERKESDLLRSDVDRLYKWINSRDGGERQKLLDENAKLKERIAEIVGDYRNGHLEELAEFRREVRELEGVADELTRTRDRCTQYAVDIVNERVEKRKLEERLKQANEEAELQRLRATALAKQLIHKEEMLAVAGGVESEYMRDQELHKNRIRRYRKQLRENHIDPGEAESSDDDEEETPGWALKPLPPGVVGELLVDRDEEGELRICEDEEESERATTPEIQTEESVGSPLKRALARIGSAMFASGV